MPRISITAGATAGNKRRPATHYGRRDIEDVVGSAYVPALGVSVLEYQFSFDDLPVSGVDSLIPRIPAGSVIRSSILTVVEPMTGTSGTITMGLAEPDGTAIDVDGLDAAVAQAVLIAKASIVGDGALIGVGIGVEEGQVVVTTGGTVTAGKFILRVEFEPLNLRA